ncbi:hypothetical protein QYM36_003689 [Artemia franciscana]|uniref:PiggyBac transposable element-derived protein domain-containing protein n=1 Tax=Artemia franciscana TaxID=6661 RepID=A0AA88L7Q7_ARTSF|nr:hypothetical protein QYM36_003689 [Artemia franciscana]
MRSLKFLGAECAAYAMSTVVLSCQRGMKERDERLFRSQATRNANQIFSRDETVQHILEPDGELSDLEEDLNHNEATKWFDNKSVCIASSFVGAEPSDNCKRWDSKLRKYVDVVCPLCIAKYNKFMGGVDLSDVLIELYRIDIRGKKSYISLFTISWTFRLSTHG